MSDICGMMVNIGARRLLPFLDEGYATLYEPSPTGRGYSFHASKMDLFQTSYDWMCLIGGAWLYPGCSNTDRLTTRNQAVEALPNTKKVAIGIGTSYPSIGDGRLLSMDLNDERAMSETSLFRSFDLVVVRDPYALQYLEIDPKIGAVLAQCPSFYAFPEARSERPAGTVTCWRHYSTLPRAHSHYRATEDASGLLWGHWQAAMNESAFVSDAVCVVTRQDAELFRSLYPRTPFYRAADPHAFAVWLGQFRTLHSARDTIANVGLSMGMDVVVYPTDTRFASSLLGGAKNHFSNEKRPRNFEPGVVFTPWTDISLDRGGASVGGIPVVGATAPQMDMMEG